jgi:hypothetical protein
VVKQHWNDGERSQAVDIGTVLHGADAGSEPRAAKAVAVPKADTPDSPVVPKRTGVAAPLPLARKSSRKCDPIIMRPYLRRTTSAIPVQALQIPGNRSPARPRRTNAA